MYKSSQFRLSPQKLSFSGREALLERFCDTCVRPISSCGCGNTFTQFILNAISCPKELADTHYVCQFCLSLEAKRESHLDLCVFAQNNVKLNAVGWSSEVSSYVLKSLRQARPIYQEPILNLLRVFLTSLKPQHSVVVPVPMGRVQHQAKWIALLQVACASFQEIDNRTNTDTDKETNSQIVAAILRNKQSSTKASVAQIRKQIAQQEYMLNAVTAPRLANKRIILIDDNVTTGITMMRCLQLLEQIEPAEVIPVVIERTISRRLQQYIMSETYSNNCSYYQPKNA